MIRATLKFLLVLILIPLLIPLAVVALATHLIHGAVLYALVWLCWCTRGKHILLVYSDSPVWRDYVEDNIIPRLPPSTIVLNWSRRCTWRWYSLPVMVFRFFGGTREFNPMVVVLRPFRRARRFRFWQAFKDYKHGNKTTLQSLERDMFACLSHSKTGRAT
jgi:hypothetical protein